MARLAVATLMVLLAGAAMATATSTKNYPSKYAAPRTSPALRFKKDHRFRVMQVADVHYQNGASTGCGDIWTLDQANEPGYVQQEPCSDLNSTAWLAAAVARVKPHLVIFTGDNQVYGGQVDQEKSLLELTKPLRDANVPWMMTWGNHDCEDKDCRANLTMWDRSNKLSLTRNGPKGLHGVGNYAYTIGSYSSNKPKHALYLFDQGAYYAIPNAPENSQGYDYVRPDQVDWYNKTSIALEKKAGKLVTATAWFHIPLPEYDSAYQCQWNKNITTDGTAQDFGTKSRSGMGLQLSNGCNGTLTGVFQEGVYSANINGGLFSAFVTRGDVKMTNVGHDHVNDWCATFLGVRMCYGGGFGYHAYGKTGWPRRTRVVDIFENGTIHTFKMLDAFGDYAEIDHESF